MAVYRTSRSSKMSIVAGRTIETVNDRLSIYWLFQKLQHPPIQLVIALLIDSKYTTNLLLLLANKRQLPSFNQYLACLTEPILQYHRTDDPTVPAEAHDRWRRLNALALLDEHVVRIRRLQLSFFQTIEVILDVADALSVLRHAHVLLHRVAAATIDRRLKWWYGRGYGIDRSRTDGITASRGFDRQCSSTIGGIRPWSLTASCESAAPAAAAFCCSSRSRTSS